MTCVCWIWRLQVCTRVHFGFLFFCNVDYFLCGFPVNLLGITMNWCTAHYILFFSCCAPVSLVVPHHTECSCLMHSFLLGLLPRVEMHQNGILICSLKRLALSWNSSQNSCVTVILDRAYRWVRPNQNPSAVIPVLILKESLRTQDYPRSE